MNARRNGAPHRLSNADDGPEPRQARAAAPNPAGSPGQGFGAMRRPLACGGHRSRSQVPRIPGSAAGAHPRGCGAGVPGWPLFLPGGAPERTRYGPDRTEYAPPGGPCNRSGGGSPPTDRRALSGCKAPRNGAKPRNGCVYRRMWDRHHGTGTTGPAPCHRPMPKPRIPPTRTVARFRSTDARLPHAELQPRERCTTLWMSLPETPVDTVMCT